MKKVMALLSIIIFMYTTSGCAEGKEQPVSEPESLAGYIVIEDNKLYLKEVEIITPADEERMAELGLEQEDMPSGYHINNLNTLYTFELTDETIYAFVDFHLLFVEDENGDRKYTTTKKEEFIQHLNTSYYDFPPAQQVPFFVQVKDGKVITITERFEFTI